MAALLMGISSVSFAQDVNFGVRAGMNFGSIAGNVKSYNNGARPFNDIDSKVKPGFSLGAIVDISFTDNIALQPGLYYTNKGMKGVNKFKFDSDNESYEKYVYGLHYLEIPVLASYRMDVAKDLNWQINVGPYIGVGLGGKLKTMSEDKTSGKVVTEEEDFPAFGVTEDVTDPDDYKACLNRFDFGLSFGTGVLIKEHYYVGIKYDLGLVNVLNTSEKNSSYYYDKDVNGEDGKSIGRLTNFQISFGYNF